MARIPVTGTIAIEDDELSESFVLASGPGGQNVNKVSSAVQLRFDVAHSPSLPEEVRARLMPLCGRRLTKDGVLIIVARAHRTQERNRAEAREKLIELIARAATAPTPRRPTKPTKASKRRRLDAKTARAKIKRARGKVRDE
ncbi:MAG TPA: alternative ribosome rescue aminoacyl-tRNA hydrolase ArfB [Micropepsaceae bacterium]|jgi:ribosome-associated protein|nr:alternative ribosome rescue aminoacyl-tRNA hydrolase ArfB [Micropepsaceae bacterium]